MVLFCHPPPPLRISFHCENKGNCLSQCAGGTAADVRDEQGGLKGEKRRGATSVKKFDVVVCTKGEFLNSAFESDCFLRLKQFKFEYWVFNNVLFYVAIR